MTILQVGQPKNRFILFREEIFFLSLKRPNRIWASSTPTVQLLSGIKQLGREAVQLPPFTVGLRRGVPNIPSQYDQGRIYL